MTTSALSEIPKDWTIIPANKTYYDSSTDQYVSTILLNQEVVAEDAKSGVFSSYYSLFLDNILAALAKETADGTEASAITYGKYRADLIKKIEVIQDFISPFPNIKQKILLGIPKDQIDRLSDAPPPDLEDSLKSSYSLDSFYDKIDLVAEKFQQFQADYIEDISKMKNSGYKGLDFILEADNLYSFSSNLNNLITSNDIDSSIYENVEIHFNNSYEIVYISLFGFLTRTTLAVSFSDFINTNPQNRPQTNYFIYSLDELYALCKSASITYQNIIETRFLNTPSKNSASNSNIIKRTDKNSTSYGISNKDIDKGTAAFKEISKRSVKLFQNAVLDSIYDKPCLTPELKAKKDKELEESEEEKLTFAEDVKNQIGDAFLNSLPDILQKVSKKQGKEALQSLGKDVLNRLGFCGLGDLISLVANTAMSYLNADEYSEEISKCALENLDNDKLYALSKNIGKFGKSTEIVEKYRQLVGDTILPWKAKGYNPPDYNKNLKTDDALYEKYTLKVPTSDEEAADIDVRFRAYKESVNLYINPNDLLSTLLDIFPDEMGWIGFFTDLTTGVLSKCTTGHSGIIKTKIALNPCKRINMPKLPEASGGGSSVFSSLATIVVEEIKNIIIGLIVRLITSTMSQLFQIISAGVSGDTDYFKRGGYIPDLFQNENFMHDAFYKVANNKKEESSEVNECVRQIIYDAREPANITQELSLEEVDSFLKIISVSLGEYEKIKLFKGEAGGTTYEKVRQLVADTPLEVYLKNYSDIEQIFLEIGKLLDVSKMEADYFNNLYNASLPVEFCIIETDMLDRAYLQNKPGITEEQISRMEDVLKNIQKDKLCFSASTMGNAQAPIFGQAMESILDPDGPVYGKIKEKQAEYFVEGINKQLEIFYKSYHNDLYKNKGFFDVILGNNGVPFVGYNNQKFLALLPFDPTALLSPAPSLTVLEAFKTRANRLKDVGYDSEINGDNFQMSLYQPKIASSQKSSGNMSVSFNKENILSYKVPPTTNLESGAHKISELLEGSLSPVASLRNKIKTGFLVSTPFGERPSPLQTHVFRYQNVIKDKILPTSGKTAYDKSYWTNLYDKLEDNSSVLVGSPDIEKQVGDLYKKANLNLEGSLYVPFNMATSSEELTTNYAGLILLTNIIISEIILRGTSIFAGFNPETLETKKMLSELVKNNLSQIFGSEKLNFYETICQIYLKLVETGIVENTDDNLEEITENFNEVIRSWIRGEISNRSDVLNDNKDDIDYIVSLFVTERISEYFNSTSYTIIKGLIQIGGLYNIKTLSLGATLNNGEVKNVWGNVDSFDRTTEIPYLRVEKYINVGPSTAESIPSGIQRLADLESYISSTTAVHNKISDSWPDGWKYGIRISSVYPLDISGVEESDFDPTDHPDLNSERYKNKAFLLKGGTMGSSFLLPIISFEEEIPDQTIDKLIIGSYDDNEMINNLINSEKFVDFYYAGMNIENLLTLVTIYNYESLGNIAPPPNWSKKLFEDSQNFAMQLIKES